MQEPSPSSRYESAAALRAATERHVVKSMGDEPIPVVEAKGVHVKALDGREYLDAISGEWVLNLGYGHPAIRRAVDEQVRVVAEDQRRRERVLDVGKMMDEQFLADAVGFELVRDLRRGMRAQRAVRVLDANFDGGRRSAHREGRRIDCRARDAGREHERAEQQRAPCAAPEGFAPAVEGSVSEVAVSTPA